MPNWVFIAIATPVMFLAGWSGHESYIENPSSAPIIWFVATAIWFGIVGRAVDSERRMKL